MARDAVVDVARKALHGTVIGVISVLAVVAAHAGAVRGCPLLLEVLVRMTRQALRLLALHASLTVGVAVYKLALAVDAVLVRGVHTFSTVSSLAHEPAWVFADLVAAAPHQEVA